FHRWDWPEAVRLASVSERLGRDLRVAFSARPESLVVLYLGLPEGTYFQTEDGPAARLALGDPSVRAHFINDPPYRVAPDRYRVLNFDQNTLHLVSYEIPIAARAQYAASALARGDAGTAWADRKSTRLNSSHDQISYA